MSEKNPDDAAQITHFAGTHWDAVVVGAGPTGGAAAAMLAARGRRVLLVEKSPWPREKVCGGCLNAIAVRVLKEAGLSTAVRGGENLERARWYVGRQRLELAAPGGVAILRSTLDAEIVKTARERGAEFLPGVTARLLAEHAPTHRVLELRCGEKEAVVHAGVVLACDGIGGTLLQNEPWAKWSIARRGWIGVAATCQGQVELGTVHMYIGRGGYVGAVRLYDGRVHVAAALDARACQSAGGLGEIIRNILRSCAAEESLDLAGQRFGGTGLMTRQRKQLGAHRVLAVGDACGYVEPFTGEGMGWSLTGAREVVDLLPAPGQPWPADLPEHWRAWHWATIRHSQKWCRGLRPMMHSPTLAAAGVALGRLLPAAGESIAAAVCGAQNIGARQGVVG